MLKRIVALACTLMVGAAFFVTTVGCGDDKKTPAPNPAPQTENKTEGDQKPAP
jgi:hypothetical protein